MTTLKKSSPSRATRQVLFIHSAGSQDSDESSRPFVTRLTRALGPSYQVAFPLMPDPEEPAYGPWKTVVGREVESLEDGGIIVGHSLGGSVVLKYLSEEGQHHKVAGLFLVAVPFWGSDSEEFQLARGYAEHLVHVKKIFVYHSRDDEFVPFAHIEEYARTLPQAEIRRLDGYGHLFDRGDLSILVQDINLVNPINSRS